jgi:hypothetical protein
VPTAYKTVYNGDYTTADGRTFTDLGSTDAQTMLPRTNWNTNLVCTVGESIETNDGTTIKIGTADPVDVPIGFEARKNLTYLARWVLRQPWLKVVELSYTDPDDVDAAPLDDDRLLLLRADVTAELTHADLEAAA